MIISTAPLLTFRCGDEGTHFVVCNLRLRLLLMDMTTTTVSTIPGPFVRSESSILRLSSSRYLTRLIANLISVATVPLEKASLRIFSFLEDRSPEKLTDPASFLRIVRRLTVFHSIFVIDRDLVAISSFGYANLDLL